MVLQRQGVQKMTAAEAIAAAPEMLGRGKRTDLNLVVSLRSYQGGELGSKTSREGVHSAVTDLVQAKLPQDVELRSLHLLGLQQLLLQHQGIQLLEQDHHLILLYDR